MKQRNILKDNSQNMSKLNEVYQNTDQAQRTPSRTNTKISPKHNIVKALKIKDKDKILKAAPQKKNKNQRLPIRNYAS